MSSGLRISRVFPGQENDARSVMYFGYKSDSLAGNRPFACRYRSMASPSPLRLSMQDRDLATTRAAFSGYQSMQVRSPHRIANIKSSGIGLHLLFAARSEERRVGKECRS